MVDTGPAFEILDYTTMTVLQTLPLMGRDPALSGRWLVYRRLKNGRRQIVLYNLHTGSARVIAHSRLRTDLGPPDISYPRVVYHRTTAGSSSITVYRIDRKSVRSPRTTRIDSYFNPSIDGTSVVYVRQTLQGMQVEVLNLKHVAFARHLLGQQGQRPLPVDDRDLRRPPLLHGLQLDHLVDPPRLSAAILRP